jgi:hypothetical protein
VGIHTLKNQLAVRKRSGQSYCVMLMFSTLFSRKKNVLLFLISEATAQFTFYKLSHILAIDLVNCDNRHNKSINISVKHDFYSVKNQQPHIPAFSVLSSACTDDGTLKAETCSHDYVHTEAETQGSSQRNSKQHKQTQGMSEVRTSKNT